LFILKQYMPYSEFTDWQLYFRQRPVGWREDLRTSYLMQIQGDKRKSAEIFPSVAAVLKPVPGATIIDNMKGSVMHMKMLTAVGGDKMPWL
jgi:hypothetical protein